MAMAWALPSNDRMKSCGAAQSSGNLLALDDLVAQRRERVGEVWILMRLDRNPATVERPHARRVQGLLQVHPPVDQIDEDLNLSLRLHVGAHAAEAHLKRAVGRQHHRREDRVAHALAGRGMIRMGRIHLEIGPAVVEDHAGSGHDDSRPEHVGNAGDQRDRVAVAVDDGEVGRVPVDAPRRRRIERAVQLDQRAALAEIFGGQKTLDGRRGETRIGDAPVPRRRRRA